MKPLFYTTEAGRWMDGLPIGNGRLAGILWGADGRDILSLNHEWLWRGDHRNRRAVPNVAHLEEVRDLLRARDFYRATLFANLYWGGDGGLSPQDNRVDAYQPAGDLLFSLHDAACFISRTLDMAHGVVQTVRETKTGRVQAAFAANAANGLIMGDMYGLDDAVFGCDFTLSRTEDPRAEVSVCTEKSMIVLDSKFESGLSHRIAASLLTDGTMAPIPGGLRVMQATYVRIVLNIATSVVDLEAEMHRFPLTHDNFDERMQAHRAAFAARMNTVALTLAGDEALETMPLAARIERFKRGERDNGLLQTYFDYGRYLLISSSIGGELPANLQGKWNDLINPPWDSDYHFDINLEMNYWLAEPCGLADCTDALLNYVESFYESGAAAARDMYGCRGIVLPLQTDAWGLSTPESFGWAVWIGAAAWMAQAFWNRYLYSGDLDYLRNRGYRYLKTVAQFYEDYLVADANGVLQIMPSQSPENHFVGAMTFPVSISVSAAMDVQLAHDALTYAIDASELLGINEADAAKWRGLREHLPGFPIGADGRLLEWNEEKEENPAEMGHRHLSHLYGVYPAALFTQENRATQYHAAKKSLDFRLTHGGGHTGWSRAWVACLCARFNDAAGFYEHFSALIQDFATVSLLDLHPPGVFQIDGNLGAVAAMVEAVVSCTDGKIHLLRALPEAFTAGSLQGIRTPGGHTIDVHWQNGTLTRVQFHMGYAKTAVLCGLPGGERRLSGTPGDVFDIVV